MKDELQTKLVEILTAIQSATGKAADFAMDQLPDIAQQYVVYGRAVTVVSSVALVLFAAVCFYAAFYALRNPWNTSPYSFEQHLKRSDSNQIMIVFGAVFGAIAMILSVATFDYLVWFAPKVWLIKELAMLIK